MYTIPNLIMQQDNVKNAPNINIYSVSQIPYERPNSNTNDAIQTKKIIGCTSNSIYSCVVYGRSHTYLTVQIERKQNYSYIFSRYLTSTEEEN